LPLSKSPADYAIGGRDLLAPKAPPSYRASATLSYWRIPATSDLHVLSTVQSPWLLDHPYLLE
jgi:hypothetical protein